MICIVFFLVFLQLNVQANNFEGNKQDTKELAYYIHQMSDSLSSWTYANYLSEKQQKELTKNLRDFYSKREYKAAWVDEEKEILTNLAKNKDNWTAEKVEEYMNRKETSVENLVESVPVFLVYFTTWADKDGAVHFEEDVYQFDERQLALVEK